VDPAIRPYLDLFQAPNTADLGDGTAFFIAAPLQVTNENYFMNRVDHQINDKMNMFVRYSFDSDSNVIPNFSGSASANEQDVARRQYTTIQFSNILKPNVVNSFRFAYNRTYQNFDDVMVDPRAQNLSFVPGEHFGTISFGSQGLSTNPLNFLGVDNGAPRIYRYNLFQYGDDLTYVKGAHSFKMGADFRRIQDNIISSSNSRGNYTFQDVPGFLANKPIRFDAPPPGSNAYRGDRQSMFGTYLQDDFKVTPLLTLNLGLLYELVNNPYEVNGKMANLLHLTDPAPTVLTDSFFSIAKKDFQPRVGFAWGLNASGKTVLRAGFGIFNDHILPYSYGNFSTGYPPFFSTLSDVRDPATAFTSPIPFPNDPNLTNGTPPPAQFGGYPIGTIKEPTKNSYNLSLQQQVMNNTVLELAYIGSESHHLQRNGEWNTPTPISPGVFPAVFNQANRINPRFASLTVARFDVNANYNALQIALKRRGASGLQYQVAYTYSKSIDEKSTLAGGESRQEPNTVLDLTDVRRDRGRSSFDARHNFVPTVTYPIPLRFQQKALGVILGGWMVNGIGTFRTGEPFTGRVGNNRSANGDRWAPDRANLNPGFSNDPTSGVSKGCAGVAQGTPLGTPDLWFDPCAFSRPTPGTYGNLGRNTITGPGFFNVDFSADKVFKPNDRINVQFRAEIFNLLDQAHFYAPGFNVFSGSAGHITRLVTSPGGRLTQFGLKVMF
jgi:hypothetical protein